MSLAKFSVKNPILMNMLMIIVFIGGFYVIKNIPKEEMPAVDMGAFNISVSYRGVSPEEMERNVVNKIEEELQDMDDIDYISSTSQEGMASIYVQMESSANMERAWNDINAEIDKVKDLPENASDPYILEINMREVNSICSVVISGDKDDNTLREITEDFEDDLLKIDHISKSESSGTRAREFWIEVDNDKLNQYGITYNEIKQIISTTNSNTPGGELDVGNSQYLVRTMGEYSSLKEIQDQIVRMDENGSALRLKDFTTVKDTLEERETIGKYNGVNGINIQVFKKEEGNIIDVVKDVRELCEAYEERIPNIRAEVRNDGSIRVENSINTLSSNAVMGIVLVFIVLFIFLGWKNALYAAWGIPFSFLLTIIFMNFFDVTLNNLSLFGLILVLGMIVDDAIIVLENIHRYAEMGYSKYEAAIKGTQEIMWPVIAAVATTISAFLPLLWMEGMMGKMLGNFTIVVILALTSSLIECLLLLPSHVGEFGTAKIKHKKEHKLHTFLMKHYRNSIIWALSHRTIYIASLVLVLIGAGFMMVSGAVKFEFFPKSTPKTLKINLETTVGSSLEHTNNVVTEIEEMAMNISQKDDIESIVSIIGSYTNKFTVELSSNYASVSIDFVDADKMQYDYQDIKKTLITNLANIKGLKLYKLKETTQGGARSEYDIELKTFGDDIETLEGIGDDIMAKLEMIPGLEEIETSKNEGKSEIRIIPNKEALYMNGLNESTITNTVSAALYGLTISKYRGMGIEEYDIILKADESQIASFADLQNIKVRNKRGELIPIKDLASFSINQGYSKIEHYDLDRKFTVTAQCGFYNDNGIKKKRTPSEVIEILRGSKIRNTKGILSDFEARYPGYRLEYGGIEEQQNETYSSLGLALLIAVLMIFTILATQFKSTIKPLIVMSALPFAFIGVIIGLFVTGLSFSMMTMIAVLALAGIVVNDSLVLVDFVERERSEGRDRWNSLINAGTIRLRPIIMTTVTTIAGFLPMILSTSVATEDWKPMAVAIAFGLGFATILTLYLVPVLFSITDSMKALFSKDKNISIKEALKDN